MRCCAPATSPGYALQNPQLLCSHFSRWRLRVQTDVDAESGCDLENKAGAPVDGSAAKACCKDGAPRCACGTPAPVSAVECLALKDSLTLACVLKNAAHGQAAWHGE